MLITLAGMATMKPYLPLPSALVRNCAWGRQHQPVVVSALGCFAISALQASDGASSMQEWQQKHGAHALSAGAMLALLVQYRAGLLGDFGLAQQLRRQLPHRGHVEGRRAALDLCWLDLLLLPGCAIRPEHRLNVIRLKRPAPFEHNNSSGRVWQTMLIISRGLSAGGRCAMAAPRVTT